MTGGNVLLDVLERLRAASIAQDVPGTAALYAEDAVHEFPFTRPGDPSRIEGRAAIAEFVAMVWRALPLPYSGYRTIAVHEVDGTTLVVEQEALGTNTETGAPFALPNVMVIRVDANGRIAHLRDYANPAAVTEALGA